MRKFKKMLLGMALAMGVFVGAAGSCYAAGNSISVDITANRAYGKFVCGEAGHRIKVTVYYREVHSSGLERSDTVSDTQLGNVTTAVAVRPSPADYRYLWGYSIGYVDDIEVAASGVAYA